jgi:hypothetical protein
MAHDFGSRKRRRRRKKTDIPTDHWRKDMLPSILELHV